MVKRILSICLIVIAGMTSLVASCLHQKQTQPYVMYQESRQYEEKIYYNTVEPELNDLVVHSSELSFKEADNQEKSIFINGEMAVAGVSVLLSKGKYVGVKEIKFNNNRWDIELTEDEINLLAKIVWVEARGESDKGQRAVVEVIFNRMIHWQFEGALKEVLSADGEFSSWKSRNKAEPTDKEYDNIQKVLNGETDITTLKTVYFSTKSRNDKLVVHIGGHYFNEYEFESREEQNKN